MTEALWLESKSAQLHQLILVSEAGRKVMLEQLGPLSVLPDPWRGQFVFVDRTTANNPLLSTMKPTGTKTKVSGLSNDLWWRPHTFSPEGKRLLALGSDGSGRLMGLAVLSAEMPDTFELINETRLKANQTLHAPQFCEEQIGGFIGESDQGTNRYYEWDYLDASQQGFVQRGYPSVDFVAKFGWSRSKDSQFLNVVQNVLSGRRQQFAVLISGRNEVEPSGDMVAAYDAVRFEDSSPRVFFADDTHVVIFDLKEQQRLNALELNGLIVAELSRRSDCSIYIHAIDGSQHRLGAWDVNEPHINWLEKVKDAPIAWGEIAIDLPHSETQTYAAQDLGLEENDRTVEGSLEDLTQASSVAPNDTVTYPGNDTMIDEQSELNESSDGDTVGDVPIQPRQSTQLLSSIEDKDNERLTSFSGGSSDGKIGDDAEVEANASASTDHDATSGESENALEPSDTGNNKDGSLADVIDQSASSPKVEVNAPSEVKTESRTTDPQSSESNRSDDVLKPRGSSTLTPQSGFGAWISQAEDDEDPETILRQLKPYRSDQDVLRQCAEHLKNSLERLSENEDLVLETIVAIAAAAELRAQGTRPLLEQMCAAARARLLEHATLPFVEEHFSLAALRALDHPEGRFSLVVVYEEYEQIIQSVNREDVSDAKKSKILKRTSTRYRKALEHVLFDSGKKTEVRKQSKSSDTSPSTETPLDAKETRPPEPVQPVAPEAIAPQTYRFKPLAQRFPSQAKPLQTRGASVQDRASSDILRLEDFGPSGDESFHAEETLKRVPKWVKFVLFGMSGIGGLLALVVVMLGFEYSSMLVGGGLCLGLSSLTLLGNEHKHWLASLILTAVGCFILFVTPTSVTLPEAVGPWAFWGPGVVFLSFIFLLWNGQIRANFKSSSYFDDEFD